MPLCSSEFQPASTRSGVDEAGHVGLEREGDVVGGRPAATARLWSPEAPYDWVNFTCLPASVFWNAAMIFS
jgi:hypothetical protein